jgi:hypothetical protein
VLLLLLLVLLLHAFIPQLSSAFVYVLTQPKTVCLECWANLGTVESTGSL